MVQSAVDEAEEVWFEYPKRELENSRTQELENPESG
jgi:hypothetical protein